MGVESLQCVMYRVANLGSVLSMLTAASSGLVLVCGVGAAEYLTLVITRSIAYVGNE